jgi:hypothetical protein
MSPLRLACHAAVIAWGAALLVTSRFDAPPALAPEAPMARVRPVPEAPPPVEVAQSESLAAAEPAKPEPPAPSEPQPEPETLTRVGAGDLSRGSELLGGGDFPVLSCSYESFPTFLAYARAMASLGARFAIVRRREIVGSIDVATGAVSAPVFDSAFSPRARDYTGEPGLTALARRAREQFGAGAVVMMLVPRHFDAGLFGGISRVLAERGDRHDAYREIRGRYERAAGGVRLRVDAAVRPDGSRVDLDLLFDLGAIAGARGAAT